jgi:DNA-directed RNA polymerase subunit RPC12/RpoP
LDRNKRKKEGEKMTENKATAVYCLKCGRTFELGWKSMKVSREFHVHYCEECIDKILKKINRELP